MCGICGIIGSSEASSLIKTMTRTLNHRGPDHQETWHEHDTALGHTRLAIVDLTSAANQPMSNEDGTLRLVANGEIYNSMELKVELEAKGHVFRSRSDNEVLLHLYEEFQEKFLNRLSGMFAFAIWDKRKRLLLIARDRLGIKPLYYTEDKRALSFASEIKALSSVAGHKFRINHEGLAQYLAYENTFGANTLYDNVNLLKPAHGLIWHNGAKRIFSYWQPCFDPVSEKKFTECCEQYRFVTDRAVKRHLMSDVKIASYLSSGFDSTTVAHFAAQNMNQPLATFTGTFNTKGWFDESRGAKAAARHIGADHTEVQIGWEDFAQHFDSLISALDEPKMGIGAFSQYMVARKVAEKCKVILTGHGGDELFAGYPAFKLVHLFQQITSNPLSAISWPLRTRISEWPHLIYFAGRKIKSNNDDFYMPVIMNKKMRKKILLPEIAQTMEEIDPSRGARETIGSETDSYRRLLLTYLLLYLPGLFVVEDKISMAHSLESRIPLCDNELIDTALLWPLSKKLNNNTLKAIPKTAMKGLLPDILWHMPKRGFPTPMSKWIRGPLREWTKERLLSPESSLNTLFRSDYIKKITHNYLESPLRLYRPLDEIPTHRIWMLLSLEAWLRLS